MSYDVTVGEEYFNYTYNLSGLFRAFDVHPYDWDGKTGSEVADHITAGLILMVEHNDLTHLRSEYNPDVDWGNVDSSFMWLWEVRDACANNPDEKVWVS